MNRTESCIYVFERDTQESVRIFFIKNKSFTVHWRTDVGIKGLKCDKMPDANQELRTLCSSKSSNYELLILHGQEQKHEGSVNSSQV